MAHADFVAVQFNTQGAPAQGLLGAAWGLYCCMGAVLLACWRMPTLSRGAVGHPGCVG